ncbi:Protein N-acetyltransferase, RimJ/RimL family [Allokutzneria albata]|uniref:Protein N-acetyltransferase, RimJ/RimL family n=2 Tax=Allokutzneria albata TaxID=211114 RepID=A0A1G9RI88_ALLAB|nr:Protein N-acetyltransferase, RimJ/RimL family [Allokutzneria albata]
MNHSATATSVCGMRPTLPIETDRLLLRAFTPDDFDALHDIRSRPDVVRYLYFDVQSREDVRESLAKRLDQWHLEKEGEALVLAVERKDTGRLIGDVVLFWHSEVHKRGELGFVFHPDHHGHGFAGEAAREVLRLGFEELGLHRIEGRCDARNTASARLLERLGMRREGLFLENEFVKGEWCDELVLAVLDREWKGARA